MRKTEQNTENYELHDTKCPLKQLQKDLLKFKNSNSLTEKFKIKHSQIKEEVGKNDDSSKIEETYSIRVKPSANMMAVKKAIAKLEKIPPEDLHLTQISPNPKLEGIISFKIPLGDIGPRDTVWRTKMHKYTVKLD